MIFPFSRRAACCALLVFWPIVSTQARAQAAPAASPAFRAAPLFAPASLSQRTLKNGVRGVVQSARGSGTVAVQVWVRAGSSAERQNEASAARLVEACVIGEARPTLDAIGANTVSQTARDSANFSATVAPRFAENAIRVLAGAVQRPDFSPAAFDAAKIGAASDISRLPQNGLEAAAMDLSRAADVGYWSAFTAHPYKRAPGGSMQSLLVADVAVVRAFHKRRYAGGNISVVVAGDVDADKAHQLIARYFDSAPALKTKNDAPSPEKTAGSQTVTRRGVSLRPTTMLMYRAPAITQPDDVVAMDVLLAYLGEGREASLRRLLLGDSEKLGDGETAPAVESPNSETAPPEDAAPVPLPLPDFSLEDRTQPDEQTPDEKTTPPAPPENALPNKAPATEEKTSGGATPFSMPFRLVQSAPNTQSAPAALAFDTSFLTQRENGLIGFALVTEESQKANAMKLVQEELRRLSTQEIGAAELQRAKSELIHQYTAQSETPAGRAGALGFYEMINDYKFAATYIERIRRITPTDLRRVAARYFTAKPLVTVQMEAIRIPSPPPGAPNNGGIIA